MITKATLKSRAPALFLALRQLRYLLRSERLDPETAAIAQTLCGDRLRVLAGPFAGMRYLPAASGSGLLPKLTGSCELEIQPAIETLLKTDYQTVVNVGCGEGYYAVGLAMRLPRARVHAFDIDIVARQRTRRLARLNGVSGRVRVRGRCQHRDLRMLTGPGSLIVCDCEGCESPLLDLQAEPALAATDLLVELHEFVDAGVTSRLRERFRSTHECEIFPATSRDELELPALERLSVSQRRQAVWEGRPAGMSWAWFRSKAGETAA